MQSASEAQLHVSAQMGGGRGNRGPQSAQSVPLMQSAYSTERRAAVLVAEGLRESEV